MDILPKLGVAAWCCLVPRAELQPVKLVFLKYLPTTCSKMPVQSKPIKHAMPESDEQVQREVEDRTGTCPCIWQIKVVHKVLKGGHPVKDGCTMVAVPHIPASQCLQDCVICSVVPCALVRALSIWLSRCWSIVEDDIGWE